MTLAAAFASALWLGILTSISPCPLATNIAAVTFIAKDVERPLSAVAAGLLYTLGRVVAYAVLGSLVVGGVLAIPELSFFLQTSLNKLLGPILVLVGMFLVDLLPLPLPSSGFLQRLHERAAGWGHPGAFLLGILFGLSFCPVSAALFFGGLIPTAIELRSPLAMPSLFGIGTGVPVVLFAVLIALGWRGLGAIASRISRIGWWAQRATGVAFIAIGTHFILVHIFRIW